MAFNPSSIAAPQAVDAPFGAWQAWLDAALHCEILRLRARYELSLDEFRGLYVSDEQVDRLIGERLPAKPLGEIESQCADLLQAAQGSSYAAGRIAAEFDLSVAAAAAVFVAFAPEADLKYQTLYAYLNNDVTRKWPTVDLIEKLTGVRASDLERLFREGVLDRVVPSPAHWRATGVVVGAPVREFLLEVRRESQVVQATTDASMAEAMQNVPLRTLVIECTQGSEPLALARQLAPAPLTTLREEPAEDFARRVRGTLLSARLRGEVAYFAPATFGLDSAEHPSADQRRQLQSVLDSPSLKVLAVDRRSPWRPLLQDADYEVVIQAAPAPVDRESAWREALARHEVKAFDADLGTVSRLFSLHPPQIERAATFVGRRTPKGSSVSWETLAESARRQCSTSLESLATRIETRHTWDQLILPAATFQRLKELAGAIRHREKVFREWSFVKDAAGHAALTALFSGASGTGKTISASVLANDLGLELFRIDLSAVVSKYIGETETNLENIFKAAEGSNAILFFDEADALFGKRSEVKDAHDRYANIEVAYLLQRMESYDGVMIMATNLAQNIDDAFSRRIHFEVEYPMPDEANRERLWQLLIPREAPRNPDIDYLFLSRQFALAGGDIRNVALDAAFLAAHEGCEIGMSQLIRALARQRRKQGKLPSASEFKQYFELIRGEAPAN